MTKSWKTTTAGILAILAVLVSAAKVMIDDDPLTNPDWGVVVSAVMAGVAAIFARDKNVTSEEQLGKTK